MIKNYDECGFSYFMVQSAPRYEEPEPQEDFEREARFFRRADIALSVLLIISMLTTVWATL